MGKGTRGPARRAPGAESNAQVLKPRETAWIAVVPCALVTVAAILVVGPVLGQAFLAPRGEVIFPGVPVMPEPVEHGRYVLALCGPLLLAAVVILAARQPISLRACTTRRLVQAGQTASFGFVTYCLLAQYEVVPGAVREPWSPPTRFFKPPTLLTALVFTILLLAVLRYPAARARVARWASETPRRRVLYGLLATGFVADWLLQAIHLDRTIGEGSVPLNLIPWEMSESFAVLNGRTPLVDFHSMYSHLLSYPVAAVMYVLGASVGTWTATLAVFSGLGILAVFAVFRRVTHSSSLALAVFLPFVTMSFWFVGSRGHGVSIASVFSMWPMRYGAPYLLAWLTARHIGGAAPRQVWPLCLTATLVALNNLEFGFGAFVATLGALVLGPSLRSGRERTRLLLGVAVGMAGAGLLLSALTVARTGQLPQLGYMLEFPRLFGVEGWGLEPMPTIGLHVAMYATFSAAIVVAVVRAVRSDPEPVLTSMLAWAGIFGLLAGTYYLGRSDPGNLIPLLSTWILALSLLLVAVVRDLAAHARLPTLPEFAVIFGFGLAIATLPSTPTPWSQVARLEQHNESLFEQRDATRFVARMTEPGERVAIFAPLGFRIAHDLSLVNVSPYVSLEAMRTPAQIDNALDAVRRLHVHRVFMKSATVGEESGNLPAVQMAFESAGFALRAEEPRLLAYTDASVPR